PIELLLKRSVSSVYRLSVVFHVLVGFADAVFSVPHGFFQVLTLRSGAFKLGFETGNLREKFRLHEFHLSWGDTRDGSRGWGRRDVKVHKFRASWCRGTSRWCIRCGADMRWTR